MKRKIVACLFSFLFVCVFASSMSAEEILNNSGAAVATDNSSAPEPLNRYARNNDKVNYGMLSELENYIYKITAWGYYEATINISYGKAGRFLGYGRSGFGSCIRIGNEIWTLAHVVTVSKMSFKYPGNNGTLYSLTPQKELEVHYEIIMNGDIRVPLKLKWMSKEMDIAIFALPENVTQSILEFPYKIGDDALLSEGDYVEIWGHPRATNRVNRRGGMTDKKILFSGDFDIVNAHQLFTANIVGHPGDSGSPVVAYSNKTGEPELVGFLHGGIPFDGYSTAGLPVFILKIGEYKWWRDGMLEKVE